MDLKVGEIYYANMRPFFQYVDRDGCAEENVTFIRDVPAQINRQLAAGTLDVAAISSFSYALHADNYVLLPNLGVSSCGNVHSLLLFAKVPLTALAGKTVALTTSSETTVHLLKLILKRFVEVEVTYHTMRPDLANMLHDHAAALLIGDDAIAARKQKIAPYVYDLGALWYEWTGLPMTYALFAVRKAVAEEKKANIHALYEQFQKSYAQSHADDYQQLSEEMAVSGGASRTFWQQYFHDLHYEWFKPQQQGLLYYFQLCYEEGFIQKPVTRLSAWDIAVAQSW